MSKNNIIRRLACLVLCFCVVFIASSNVVFAGGKNSLLFGNSYVNTKKDKPKALNPMQSFILDSMDSKNNEDIAIELSNCNKRNISQTSKSISRLLNGTWKSKKGEEKLSDILNTYLDYTPKAQLCLWAVIDEGFDGVVIPITLSNKLKSKINYDFTGDYNDDRGSKFMVKSLLIFDEVAELVDEELLSIKYGKYNTPKIVLNRLEDYEYITDSVTGVLSSLETLPFKADDFDGFIDYYETYINDCGIYGIFSFLRLLDANGIQYTAKK